jgi:hypothetical protein
MSAILTEELVNKALNAAVPTIETLLQDDLCVWGPRYVAVWVSGPDVDVIRYIPEKVPDWDPAWGPQIIFSEIARAKLEVADRTGMSTADTLRHPWVLQPGDTLYEGAVVSLGGLSVAISGAKGQADDGIARLILAIIEMYCRLELRSLQEQKITVL